MGKDARNRLELTEDARKKFEECVAAFASCGFGEDGPPVETTFVEIEEFGHEVGKMLARAIDERLMTQHASNFQGAAACPICQTDCSPKPVPAKRDLKTTDGDVPIEEPVCRCPVCDRDFFPSAYSIEN
jgi:hypothetical protein